MVAMCNYSLTIHKLGSDETRKKGGQKEFGRKIGVLKGRKSFFPLKQSKQQE